MVVWSSHVVEIIIIRLGVVKQHVRFIRLCFENRAKKKNQEKQSYS